MNPASAVSRRPPSGPEGTGRRRASSPPAGASLPSGRAVALSGPAVAPSGPGPGPGPPVAGSPGGWPGIPRSGAGDCRTSGEDELVVAQGAARVEALPVVGGQCPDLRPHPFDVDG